MAPRISALCDVLTDSGMWKINVCVLYTWLSIEDNKPNGCHMILGDNNGDKIQASIPKFLFEKFANNVKEGCCYYMERFKIGDNKGEYKTTSHPKKIFFAKYTVFRERDDLRINYNKFDFIKVEYMIANEFDSSVLRDFIVEVKNTYPAANSIDVDAYDEDNSYIPIKLWADYGSKVDEYVKSLPKKESFVLILRYAKAKLCKGEI